MLAFMLMAVALDPVAFRAEHKEIKAHLEHVAQWAGGLPRAADKHKTAEKIVEFFAGHIRPHAEWEEANLYPAVDERAGTGEKNRYTSTMRYEHRIVGRWIDALSAELKKPRPDWTAFVRRTDNLLGLITAHFEEEEEVLLPWLEPKPG